jgi:hypothetical protein
VPRQHRCRCALGCSGGVSRDRNSMETINHHNRLCLPLCSQSNQPYPHWHPSHISASCVSIPIQHSTQLPCAPHKLVRTPDTQPRQHLTHRSLCKVVLCARASARCCAPAWPMFRPTNLPDESNESGSLLQITLTKLETVAEGKKR